MQTDRFQITALCLQISLAEMVGDSDPAKCDPDKDYTLSAITVDAGRDSVWAWSDDRASGHYDDSELWIWASGRQNKTIDDRKSRLKTDRNMKNRNSVYCILIVLAVLIVHLRNEMV